MRLVLDTNNFDSALLLPHSVPAELVKPWLAGCFSVITAQDQVDEIARATRHSKIRERLRLFDKCSTKASSPRKI